jgi:hypothetical protein
MKTGENSQVAITSVDQNVLLENQGNDLSRNRLYNELRLYDNAGDIDLDASYTESYRKLLVSWVLRDNHFFVVLKSSIRGFGGLLDIVIF